MARARWVSTRGSTLILAPSTFAATSAWSTSESAPLGPFTLTTCPSTLAVTPEGTATGFLPTRDMILFHGIRLGRSAIGTAGPVRCKSEHRAEDFSAHIVVAGVVIRHHAFGRGQDRDPQSVVHARQCLYRRVDPSSRLRHPRNLADDRLAVEIFQLDLDFLVPVGMLARRIAADEALGLEHVEHALAQPGGRRRDLRLVAHLGIVNARDHVAERIVDTHPRPPTSST